MWYWIWFSATVLVALKVNLVGFYGRGAVEPSAWWFLIGPLTLVWFIWVWWSVMRGLDRFFEKH